MNTSGFSFSPFDFGEIIHTKKQASEFLDYLDKLSDAFFNVKEPPAKKMKSLLPYQQYYYLERLAQKNNVSFENLEQVKEFLGHVKTFIRNIPVVTIEVAFSPSEETIANLSNYIAIYIKRAVLFDIVVNKKLVAGATLSYNGRYKDYSLKKKFDEALRREAETIIASL